MAPSPDPRIPWYTPVGEVTVEKLTPDKPHQGKVLAAVQAHADDIPLFCAGLVAKLIAEGYTAYLIQTTNDEKCGPGTMGETILQNEREIDVLAEELGLQTGHPPRLSQSLPRRSRPHRAESPAGLSDPRPQNRHHHHLQSLGPLGGKPRSLRHWPSRRSRPLDGWHEQGLPRTASLRYAASLGQRPLLLDLPPRAALQHRRRYSASSRPKGRRHERQQGPRPSGCSRSPPQGTAGAPRQVPARLGRQ